MRQLAIYNEHAYPFGLCYDYIKYWGRFSMVLGRFLGFAGGSANPMLLLVTIHLRGLKEPLPPKFLPDKLEAYSGGIQAATSLLSGAGEGGGGTLITFEAGQIELGKSTQTSQ